MDTTSLDYDGDDGWGTGCSPRCCETRRRPPSSVTVDYLPGERLPPVVQQSQLADHARGAHGLIETTSVRIVPLNGVVLTPKVRAR